MSAATRRHVLAASLGAVALTSCALTESPPVARRTPLRAKIVAPASIGRPGRADAWNRRYGEDLGALLEVESPLGVRLDALPDASALLRAAGDTAHILWTPHEAIADLALRGALKPLDDLVKRDRVDLKAFMPCALQPAYGLDSHLYAFPEQVDAGQLYFNRQHLLDAGIDFRRAGLDFERPNSNWETLRRAALDLLLGRAGRDRLPWHPGAAGAPLEVWGWANGGAWLSPDGQRATFTRDENVAALEWLVAQAAEVGGPRLPPPERLPDVATSGSRSGGGSRGPPTSAACATSHSSAATFSSRVNVARWPSGLSQAPPLAQPHTSSGAPAAPGCQGRRSRPARPSSRSSAARRSVSQLELGRSKSSPARRKSMPASSRCWRLK